MNREEHNRIVAAGLKGIKQAFPIKDSTDLDQLIQRLKEKIKTIDRQLEAIDHEVKLKGLFDLKAHKMALLDLAQPYYLKHLSEFTQDELHLLFSVWLSDRSVAGFV